GFPRFTIVDRSPNARRACEYRCRLRKIRSNEAHPDLLLGRRSWRGDVLVLITAEPVDVEVVVGGKNARRIRWVIDHPTAISPQKFEMVVGVTGDGYQGPI